MSPASDRSGRRRLSGQAMIPAALVLLVALVAGLTYHARAAERSHRATAVRALRDYAAFAAWQFKRHASERLSASVYGSLSRVRDLTADPESTLPGPELLSNEGARCSCGFGADMRLSFRVELPSGRVDTHGAVDTRSRGALNERLRELAFAAARESVSNRRNHEDTKRWARLTVDTSGGVAHALAYTIVRDRGGEARAAYGVVADVAHLTKRLKCIVDHEPLLPPSLLRLAPNDSVLRIRVEGANSGVLFTAGRPVSETGHIASDTLEAFLGGLVATVEIEPGVAASLVIGGIPATRLPLLLAILGAAALLAVVALVQLRRGRELARLRGQFVANVSHELRTPLAQISMFSETLLLERQRSTDEGRHFLSVIFREARRLTNLVDSVLRFSSGEAGMSRIRTEPRDVTADVYETLRSFEPLAAAADVEVESFLAEEAHASADPGAVRQIVLNLLDNAVKYGPRGQTVTVRVARERDVIVSVEDEGPGIPAADRLRIFEPFARLERAGAPRVSGAGIGLAVVRDLVGAHGGRVWVEDGEAADGSPRGTRVSFSLPAGPRAGAHDASRSADGELASAEFADPLAPDEPVAERALP